MRPQDVIRRKRNGDELSVAEIQFFVNGVVSGEFADYQAAALLMAIFLNGMSQTEEQALAEAMLGSGEQLNLVSIPLPKVDKHSTGGVGDKTSLIAAPLVAAAGLCVPMISGRGLSHTGGTLDKLEAIPGFRVDLSLVEFGSVLQRVGLAITGQTAEVAPADKKLYALRDVTETVDSIPLIATSIMSKKLAEGLNGLVIDVKTGNGAFMKTTGDARRLAASLVRIGTTAGVQTTALITDMDQPLGRAVGNRLEVIECFEILRSGHGAEDLISLSVELAAQMLFVSSISNRGIEAERKTVHDLLRSGAGLKKLRQLIEAQGGDAAVVDDYTRMPPAPHEEDLMSESTGFVARIEAEKIGRASMLLGAGRTRAGDEIDPAVGLVLNKKIGDAVQVGEPLLRVHYNDDGKLNEAKPVLRQAFHISAARPKPRSLIKAVLQYKGV